MDEETSQHEEEERHRRQDIIGAMDSIPIDMDFNDGCVLLDLAYTIRKQTRHGLNWSLEQYWKWLIGEYETDSNGRFTTLHLEGNDYAFNLPSIIERLQKLKDITLLNCQLIPIELDNLPFLETLVFSRCPEELFQNMPEGMQLASLKIFTLEANFFLLPPTVAWITNCMDNLEELHLDSAYDGPELSEDLKQDFLRVFQDAAFSFCHSLKMLDIAYLEWKEKDLETVLFDILPRFPNLHELNFGNNKLESLQMIASRIIKLQSTDEMAIPDNCLRKLDLIWNPVKEKICDGDSKENEALLTILNTFNEISNLGFHSYCDCSDVEYLLRINHAGRKFITGRGEDGDGGTAPMTINNNNNNSEQSLPLRMTKRIKPELWPTILERAYEKSDEVNNGRKKCSTGMFYLLRNGSVLEDIIAMRQGSSNINSNSSNGNSNNSSRNDNRNDNRNGNKRPRSSRSSMNATEDEGSDIE